jgi:biotin transport system permease protein
VTRPARRALPVWFKLLGLLVCSAVIIAADRPLVGAVAAAGAIGGAAAAGVRMRAWRRLALPVGLMVLLVGALQLVGGSPDAALASAARLGGIGMLAVTFTLTTPPGEIVAWVESALARLGLGPRRVFRVGLVVGLTTRSLDHLGEVGRRVLDARRARGLQRSLRAFAVPVTVEAARFAHGVGEALDARGIGAAADRIADPQPYRLIGRIERTAPGTASARWLPSGQEMGPAATAAGDVPPHLVLEAMVQTAGMLLAAERSPDPPDRSRWLLAGLDDVTVGPARQDRPVDIVCTATHDPGRAGRVVAAAVQDGRDLGAATVLMVARDPSVEDGA